VPTTVRMLHTLAGLGDSDGDRVVVGDSVAVPEGEMRPTVHASGSQRIARTCVKRMGEEHDVHQGLRCGGRRRAVVPRSRG
jgi:hypothetical protein